MDDDEDRVDIDIPLTDTGETDFKARIKSRKQLIKSHKNSMKLKNYDKAKKTKAIKEAARAAKIHETNNEEDFYIPTIIENNNGSSSNEGSGGNQYKKLPATLEDIDEDELERAAMQASIAAHMKQPSSSSTEGVGSVGKSVRTTLRRSSMDLIKKVENVASRVDQARQTITRTLGGGDGYSKFDNYGGNNFSIDDDGNIFMDPTEERKKKIKFVIRFTLILLIIFLVSKMILWTKSVDDQYSHIPYAPIGLKDMCSPMLLSAGDSDLCKKYCQPAMCCWSPYEKNKCSAESNRMADVCSGYETYCQTLSYNLGDEASSYYMNPSATAAGEANNKNQIIDSAPLDLAQECALTPSGSLIHHQACLAACQPASCCFEISPALSCLEANPEQCEDYKRGGCIYLPAKGFLTDHTSSLPPKPSSLEYTCSLQSISKAEEMHDLCVTLCEPALCCIGLGNVRNCAAEKDSAEQLCKEYSPHCKNVWPYSTEIAVNNPGSTQHFEIPSPLYAVCSMQEHANPDLCDSACDLGSCCWNKDPDQNCEKDYAQICAEYHSCPHYKMNAPDFYQTSSALNDDFIDDDSSLSVKMPEVSMDILCSISNLLSDEGLSKCRRECEKAKCCFASSHNSCLDNFSATCDLYAPCSSLPPDFSSSSTNNNDKKQSSNSNEKNNIAPPQPVDELCSEGNLRTKKGRDLCSQICEAGMCCFEQASDENCFLDNPSRCREYDACRAMFQVPEPQVDIESKCEPLLSSDFSYNIKNNADLSLADSQKLCKDACKPASCCWEPEPGNCYQQNAVTCQKYEVCSMVDDSSSSLSVWSDGFDTSTVTQLCSTENKRSKQGLEQCQKACSVASCCVNNNNEEEEWMEGTSSSECGDEFCSFYMEQCEDVLIHAEDNNKGSALLPTTSSSSSQNNAEISNESSLELVQIVCSEESVNRTPDGRQKCKDECSMVTCCVVPPDSPYSCVEQNPYYCSTHVDACEILTAQYQEEGQEDSSPYYDTGLPFAPPELEDRFCTDTNIRTFSGRSKCEEMCAVSSCCFAFSTGDQASSFSCYEENQEACDTYSVCVKLRDFNY